MNPILVLYIAACSMKLNQHLCKIDQKTLNIITFKSLRQCIFQGCSLRIRSPILASCHSTDVNVNIKNGCT